ncbi:Crp/Fnr family transcriptional regulator [Mucilaginibacter achroorhodeus]|uniref:Crp/Fnr family transcriptional regulator n=1 Tax=Mucilaginibacter achroorhodeus TaxID=2599294 RepID=A0A563TZR6_9SPHI|nr:MULTISPECIES: Crp/Fnr family transcriptional regulator [Mucilaginibacter]QXV65699.1 Crp/Fnr family transcriptional regulator [Mucilaginibacter sp. 21P]TWR24874.1 Crp/Fnr family transcriptional regulator [Mucilaginibacter achroorhodeus]
MGNALINFLQQHRFFTKEEEDTIKGAFETRSYHEGDHLSDVGKICRELFFICDGILRITSVNQKGVELTHFFLKEGSFCTILYSFNNHKPADEGIQAACDTEVLAINKDQLTILFAKLPGLKELIDRVTQEKLLEKIKTRNAFLGEESDARYQLFLKQQPDVAKRVALKDIASYLGITPQSLSRIRRNSK